MHTFISAHTFKVLGSTNIQTYGYSLYMNSTHVLYTKYMYASCKTTSTTVWLQAY